MNITIISNNYYPEDSGIGLYSAGMAEYLAQNHNVKVITAMPYYPQWELSIMLRFYVLKLMFQKNQLL